jgi:hypothetical protein
MIFLAVLDADASSPHYGQAVASVAVPGPGGTPHHTELEMPEGGFLLANAFESGRSMLFDLRQPQHPSPITSFGDLDGYMHPHTISSGFFFSVLSPTATQANGAVSLI